jgi:hypothetical protein
MIFKKKTKFHSVLLHFYFIFPVQITQFIRGMIGWTSKWVIIEGKLGFSA